MICCCFQSTRIRGKQTFKASYCQFPWLMMGGGGGDGLIPASQWGFSNWEVSQCEWRHPTKKAWNTELSNSLKTTDDTCCCLNGSWIDVSSTNKLLASKCWHSYGRQPTRCQPDGPWQNSTPARTKKTHLQTRFCYHHHTVRLLTLLSYKTNRNYIKRSPVLMEGPWVCACLFWWRGCACLPAAHFITALLHSTPMPIRLLVCFGCWGSQEE